MKKNVTIQANLSQLSITLDKGFIQKILSWFTENRIFICLCFISAFISGFSWIYFSSRGLQLTYNDAVSHLDISRRVFDNLKPGLAQIGSVWLPLMHLLMLPTIWIDSFWHSGFSGGIISMISYVLCILFTYKTVRLLECGILPALFASAIVAINTNFLFVQTTALTEPLLMINYLLGLYYLLLWIKTKQPIHLVFTAFFVMLATLSRYDGWIFFLLIFGAIGIATFLKEGWKKTEGLLILFGTLAGLGIAMWVGWNLLIFGNPFYFAFSEYSAKAQQDRILVSGLLLTYRNLFFSLKTYFFAMIDNIGIYVFLSAAIGWLLFMFKSKNIYLKMAGIVFLTPIIANVIALYEGHAVIFLPETMGNSWFNVRYGLPALPFAAILIGYLIDKSKNIVVRVIVPLIIIMQIGLFFTSRYTITITDVLVGKSQKNVSGIGEEIRKYTANDNGLILASVASHDAILFASGLPLKRFIHEGVGKLWLDSLENPDQHAKYILMRTHDNTDAVSKAMIKIDNFDKMYTLVYKGDFADVYQRIQKD